MHGIQLKTFGREDVDQALRLSDAAGWNQIANDWKRIIDLEPDGCLGAWSGDRLVGTTTFVTYGKDLAWIGMVLVDPHFRRQGIGRRLFEATMERLNRFGAREIGLDATEYGRSLYVDAGFVDVAPIVRWQGRIRPPAARTSTRIPRPSIAPPAPDPAPPCRRMEEGDLEAVISLDREFCELDRSRLLRHLLREDGTVGLVLEDDGGFAYLRPGRTAWQLGPMLVPGSSDTSVLLEAAARYAEDDEVVVDSVEDDARSPAFEALGIEPRRRLMRMTFERPCALLTNRHTAAATSFAWG